MLAKIVMAALGLALGMLALLMGLGAAGGGHGWVGALWCSLPLPVLYPLVFVRAVGAKSRSSDGDAIILGIAGVLDLLLFSSMAAEQQYVARLWTFDSAGMLAWLALWSGWQVVGLATLLRKRLGRDGARSG